MKTVCKHNIRADKFIHVTTYPWTFVQNDNWVATLLMSRISLHLCALHSTAYNTRSVNYRHVHTTVHSYCIIIQIDNNQDAVMHRSHLVGNNAIGALSVKYSIGLELLDLINVELNLHWCEILKMSQRDITFLVFSRSEIDDRATESIKTCSSSYC